MINEGILTSSSLSQLLDQLKEENKENSKKLAEFNLTLKVLLCNLKESVKNTEDGYVEAYGRLFAANFITQYTCSFTSEGEVSGINNFVKKFKAERSEELSVRDNNVSKKIYKSYMNELYNTLLSELNSIPFLPFKQKEDIYYYIEEHVLQLIYSSVFPKQPTQKDETFYIKCLSFTWIEPKQLDILGNDLSTGSLDQAIKCI